MGFLPYWWRFLQCLNKRHYTKQNVHLINAGKYFSDLLIPLAALWYTSYDYNKYFWIWFGIHMFASLYSYAWDIYMDWGLLRHFENDEKKYLRKKIFYHPYFYYYAIVSDFILRFVWIFGIWLYGSKTDIYNRMQGTTLILMSLEAFRRT